MKLKRFMTGVGLIVALAGVGARCGATDKDSQRDDDPALIFADPLQKIFRYTNNPSVVEPVADVARGEYATFQLVYKAPKAASQVTASLSAIQGPGGAAIRNAQVRYVGYVKQGRYAEHPADDVLKSQDGFFPDPLYEEPLGEVAQGKNQPLWITVPIAASQQPGLYKGQVTVNVKFADGTSQTYNRPFQINVYKAKLGAQTLWNSNWAALLNAYHIPVNNPANVQLFSDEYWNGIRNMARLFVNYKQNVVKLEVSKMVDYSQNGGTYSFNFDNFDKAVSIFLAAGVKRIEGDFIAARMGGLDSELGFLVPNMNAPKSTKIMQKSLAKMETSNTGARSFFEQFLPALYKHLVEKGWQKIYYQHISDEPVLANYQTYGKMVKFVRQLVPDLLLTDALLQPKPEDLDVNAPQLAYFQEGYQKFLQNREKSGSELWYYVCRDPQYNYVNRFLETQLIKTRFLYWVNYKYKLTGFIHWGFNLWDGYPFDFSKDKSIGGDAWAVYPYKGKLLASIRLEAQRDGLNDYELLKILEKRNKSLAESICNSHILYFNKYNTDAETFRQTRKKLLAALSR